MPKNPWNLVDLMKKELKLKIIRLNVYLQLSDDDDDGGPQLAGDPEIHWKIGKFSTQQNKQTLFVLKWLKKFI